MLGPPVAGSVAERAGLRAGDWVRALAHEGDNWQDLRSLTDLRWELTQAVLQRQPVQLQVTDRDGRGSRTVRIDLSGIEPGEVDAELSRRIGLGGPWREPVLGEVKAGGPAALAGLRSGDRVLGIDGLAIDDAQTVVERVRGSLRDGRPESAG